MGNDTEYRELQDFVDWSLQNNLQINASKTKELVVDLCRRNNPPPAPVNTCRRDALVKKGNSRLFLLRRLRSFGVQGPLLRTFYESGVGSAIFYGIVCWSSSITHRDRKRMDRLVRRASSVLGCPLDSVEVVGNGLMAKLSSMLNNTSHPLQDTLAALGSSFSERLLHPRCVKERYHKSFLPAAGDPPADGRLSREKEREERRGEEEERRGEERRERRRGERGEERRAGGHRAQVVMQLRRQ
ncbi:hypothetical protein D4764_0227710 [Takifugu flavidus]|uniref:Alkylated DNA repair protein AlkB homologue 8 N-terminal domain-containing protein n=1 Tax=Takifugu flavidus TaxID=433684 RepID=A0A5C6MI62_9TELE|nr:hypothetical protein D4764_0227710 [Takifugu flavidus]